MLGKHQAFCREFVVVDSGSTTSLFVGVLDKERQWFDLLNTLRQLRCQRTVTEDSPEGHAVFTCCSTGRTGSATEMNSPTEFTPDQFLALLERERRWCELLISAILTRRKLRDLDVKLLADDTVAVALEKRARWLRN